LVPLPDQIVTKRKRRSPGEARGLILAAAKHEFAENGYAGATTKSIADRAGVVEPLLFRNFGTKAALFNEAVFGPIRAFVLDWEASPEGAAPPGTHEREFITQLYDLLHDNRGLVVSYLATSVFDPDVLDSAEATPGFVEVVQVIDRLADHRLRAAGRKPTGRSRATGSRVFERLQIGSVLAAALFDDLLFAATKRPSREAVIDELVWIMTATEPTAP
jgi:AcrR family transcriptional regulator